MKKYIGINTNLQKKKPNTVFEPTQMCPFCDSNILKTNVILEKTDHFTWIENKYPVLEDAYQTVLLEHPSCGQHIGTYSKPYLYALMDWCLSKWNELEQTNRYRSVLFFKNHGKQADSSIQHAHMQLVGLTSLDYREELNPSYFEGITIAEKDGVVCNLSTSPMSEFHEFNIMVEETSFSHAFSDFLQDLVNYILEELNPLHQSLNIAFYKWEHKVIAKVIPRKPTSIFLLGYNLSQRSLQLTELCHDIQKKYYNLP